MNKRRPKGYAAWDPNDETLIVLDQVAGIFREYRDHLPLTARQIFYRLVGQHGYEKTERAYKRLTNYLVRARRAQMIPFSHIRDDGTTSLTAGGWSGPEEWISGVLDAADAFERELWQGQDQRIEVWCEAAGMAPQLARVANDYGADVHSTGGFSSVTVTHQVAKRVVRRDVPTLFIHIGDYDPSGESIFESMSEDITMFVLGDLAGGPDYFKPVRLALTQDQVGEYDLPTAPPKSSDSRSRNWYDETCQAEAMPPDLLAQLLRDRLEEEIDMDKLQEVRNQSREEAAKLVEALDAIDFGDH